MKTMKIDQSFDSRVSPTICIIPARGGSKRIKGKNIRLFRGQPMIEWSIRAAQDSNCFDRIVVSTDDEEISVIAQKAGAEVPFVRPAYLSDDFTGTREVIAHALYELALQGDQISQVCCLYATAPFVSSSDILMAREQLNKSRLGSVVFTATSFPFPIQRALRIDSEGYSSVFDPSSILKRSQDLEQFYHDAGQFYWASASTWTIDFNLFDRGRPLLLPRWRVQDIDTEEDWKRAELMHMALDQELMDA